MGKNKLRKFSEMEEIPFVLQYPWAKLQNNPFPYKGKWKEFFGNGNPIVLELGCGKGEYTTGLARIFPEKNFIGIDIKGARMWTGAKQAQSEQLTNVAFLRTDIELLPHFFAPGEVREIWITFPDPQMQKPRKRLTGSRMLGIYGNIIAEEGYINLKTDSPFLYNYTRLLCRENGLSLSHDMDDIYNGTDAEERKTPKGLKEIRTHYEQQWLDRGLTIKFLRFGLEGRDEFTEPAGAEDIPKDTYRSYARGMLNL